MTDDPETFFESHHVSGFDLHAHRVLRAEGWREFVTTGRDGWVVVQFIRPISPREAIAREIEAMRWDFGALPNAERVCMEIASAVRKAADRAVRPEFPTPAPLPAREIIRPPEDYPTVEREMLAEGRVLHRFDWRGMAELALRGGWETYLRVYGYRVKSARAVHFESAGSVQGARPTPVLLIGAYRDA